MLELNRWSDIKGLDTPFLAINATNRTAASRETNSAFFRLRQAGHWELPEVAREAGIKGRPILLFYTEKGQSTLYIGSCVRMFVSGETARNRPRYVFTVSRKWQPIGTTVVSFSTFFRGFRLSANPTVAWIDKGAYVYPALEMPDNGETAAEFAGHGGYDQHGLSSLRVGHERFVRNVRRIWGRCCSLTGLHSPNLVQACHIAPWADAAAPDRVSGNNGLMLCAHLHALFDAHLIAFSDAGELLLERGLEPGVRDLVLAGGSTELRRRLNKAQIHFLREHRAAAKKAGKRFELAL
ncbi:MULTISPECIES: HNH endonuclease signature motif containing protein [Pandoraea]|uniref:HNH nuclease domain-containing protein n=2 Tax=Pandoraea TaxID=93217 RepID=A0A5E4XM69_9BURK|nr:MULTISPECIES: HNH endonuclease signature motif containing protein [Pandoraea]VVE14479.1 hypothetical protein PCE31107_02816 [Pandoraea cepalis]VVE37373.1 hypothetical protein PTE31013_04000 [Pandoraea terrigena]